LGSLFYNGKIVKLNYKIACEHFERATKQGNLDAMNNIGICYEVGQGVSKSLEKAKEYFKKAGEKNHPQALANHAILLIKNNNSNDNKVLYCLYRLYRIYRLYNFKYLTK